MKSKENYIKNPELILKYGIEDLLYMSFTKSEAKEINKFLLKKISSTNKEITKVYEKLIIHINFNNTEIVQDFVQDLEINIRKLQFLIKQEKLLNRYAQENTEI